MGKKHDSQYANFGWLHPKNGNNYSKETIKSIYNYIRPLNYFLFLDITLFKNNRLYIIHKFQTDIQKW